jgi:hypothetical protein
MPFTVIHQDTGIKRREFDAYVRLLEKRGIDWTNTTRIPEPGTANRWLYVWGNQEEAEAFCHELQSETHDDKWVVRELPANVRPSPGPLTPVVILMRRHSLGAEFSLHPHSRTMIQRRFPEAKLVSSLSIELATMQDFEHQHGPRWRQIAMVLTGLNEEQLSQLGGYRIIDLLRDNAIAEDALANA